MYIDSHSHLYLDAFDDDRDQVMSRALESGIQKILLPNIDSSSLKAMFHMTERYPGQCHPMMGLHPTSVKENYREELAVIEAGLEAPGIVAIGECGIDLYWDSSFAREQEEVFRIQIGWARQLGLPLVIHARESFPEIFRILDEEAGPDLTGVFHSFTGGVDDLHKALSYGFMIGINGIVTFKNSGLDKVAGQIPHDKLLLETDAPFLAPVPKRGNRNESSYLLYTASRVAEICNFTGEELARITTDNAKRLFSKLNDHAG